MARERKSLVEPVLPGAGGDVLSRIIANDRERRQREEVPHPPDGPPSVGDSTAPDAPPPDTAPEDARPPEDSETGNERTNVTKLQRTNVTRLQETSEDADVAGTDATPRRRRRGPAAPGVDAGTIGAVDADVRAERLGKALALAATDEVAVVTVRVSTKLNEYMDRYVDRLGRVSPKRRYRKQDAVAEAFAAFFADHPLPPAPMEEEL